MIENTNTKQFYPGPILNNTLEITDFLFNDAAQIKITHSKLNGEGNLVDIDLNYPTDYEVIKVLPSDVNAAEAALTASTGQVTLKNVNVLAGEKLTVYRESQIVQDKDYPRTGAFPAATHEGALDYLTMQNQEQREEIARSLKVPISTPNFNAAVPVPLPNRILRINNDASGFEFVPYDLDERLDTFEDTVVENITAGQEAIENSFEEFKNETNITINNIDTKVINAVDTANTANTKSDEAIDLATNALAAATSAVDTSNSAVTSADAAVATANSADIKSDEALLTSQEAKEASLIAEENAATAKEKVDIFEQDIETVLEAADQIAQLEGSVDTAVQASEAAIRAAEDATQAAENAIASLDNKLDIDGTAVKATADAAGNIITETYADRNLSNLTELGEKHFLNKSQITNCLWEVPQRIKLELNNGVLTLKAGSEPIVPNEFEADGTTPKFDYVTVDLDVTANLTGTGKMFLCLNPNGYIAYYADTLSGSTAPTTIYTLWYDTTNNIVKTTGSSSTNITYTGCSLPFAEVTLTDGLVTSINQVFNGFGDIGSTIWADKGVKGLFPYYKNEDGTYKNVEFTTSKVLTYTRTSTYTDYSIILKDTELASTIARYDDVNNINLSSSGNQLSYAIIGKVSAVRGKISSFEVKQPFRAVDYNNYIKDLDTKADKTDLDTKADKTDLDTKVNKAGDTMTGRLNIKSANNNNSIVLTSSDVTQGSNPSAQTYTTLIFGDKDSNDLGAIYYSALTNDERYIALRCANKAGNSSQYITLGYDSSNRAKFTFPKCTTKATTTSSARSDLVAVVIQNYVNGNSWYRVWSDGWIEQGGGNNTTAADVNTITFLKAFSNTNYTFAGIVMTTDASYSNGYLLGHNKKATGCTITLGDINSSKGYSWYACGY